MPGPLFVTVQSTVTLPPVLAVVGRGHGDVTCKSEIGAVWPSIVRGHDCSSAGPEVLFWFGW